MDTPKDNVAHRRTKDTLDALDEISVTRARIRGLSFLVTRVACAGTDEEERTLFDGLAFILDDIDSHLGIAESFL